MDFFSFLNIYVNFIFVFSEEIIIIFLFYNFIKMLIFSSIFELIWPTHFFNKRNNFNQILKFRNFNDVLLKLNSFFYVKKNFNIILLRYFF